MKKKCILLLLQLLMFGTASYGAVSEDMSVYVRKDVYDANMQGMNTKLDTILEQMKLQREDIKDVREELKAQRKDVNELSQNVTRLSERLEGNTSSLSARIDGLDKRMEGLDKRIDDLRNGIYLWLVAIGLVVAIIAWPKVQDMLPKWRKSTPSITLEDVMRLIEENNLKLERKMQA